jgi:hypothetical protein
MHKIVGSVLRVLLYNNAPKNLTQARDIVDHSLVTAMHAMPVTIATKLGTMSGALVLSHDMFLNVPLIADWYTIEQRCNKYINDNLRCANRKQHQHDLLWLRKF